MSVREDFSIAELVDKTQPKFIVELGCGDGAGAAAMMAVLGPRSKLTTINWPNPPSGDNPYRYLDPWVGDARLRIVFGDTREQSHLFDDNSIDFLHIDSTHTKECATEEWRLYRPKLTDGATVVVDDLNHNDMREFWDALPYVKVEYSNGQLGVFTYVRRGRC